MAATQGLWDSGVCRDAYTDDWRIAQVRKRGLASMLAVVATAAACNDSSPITGAPSSLAPCPRPNVHCAPSTHRTGFGFAARNGWRTVKHASGSVDDATVIVTNEPIRAGSIERGVLSLSRRGILIAATLLRPVPAQAGHSVADAAAYIRWQNRQLLWKHPVANDPAFFTVAQEKGSTAFVRVYLGSPRRNARLLRSARHEVLALRLPVGAAPSRSVVPGASPLIATPRDSLNLCLHVPLLRFACPHLLPVGPYHDFHAGLQLFSAGRLVGFGRHLFNFSWWAENPLVPSDNQPPRFVHLVAVAKPGKLRRRPVGVPRRLCFTERCTPKALHWPSPDHPSPLRDGTFAAQPQRPKSFGFVTWCGQRGSLVLVPHVAGYGVQAGHLVFEWRRRGVVYSLGLHSWEPFMQTAATLHAITCSTAAAR